MTNISAKLSILLFLLLPMCAHKQEAKESFVNISSDATLQLKQPKDILPEIQLVQVLSFKFKDKSNSSQAVLVNKDNKLSIVALMPFGGEVFRVEYYDGIIHSKALPGVESRFDLKYALGDIIMVYANRDALQSWVSPKVEIIDTKNTRVIKSNSTEIVRISYDNADRFAANVKYEHLQRNYTISIQPVSQSKP
jgi:Protein of unknown function (DUF3261).